MLGILRTGWSSAHAPLSVFTTLERRCAPRGSAPSPRFTHARCAAPGEQRWLLCRVCLSFGVSPILRAAAFCRAAVLYEVGHVVLRDVPYKRQTLHNNQRCSHGARQRACVERGEGAEPLAAKQRAKAAKNPASGACAEAIP